MSLQQTIRELCLLRGISGREDAVRDYILRAVRGHCQSCMTDALGNVIVETKGMRAAGKKLLLSAHMDEVGFIVTAVEEDGTLRFSNVGGILPAVAMARPVEVGENRLPGVIGAKPIHQLLDDEKEKYTPLEDMRIDIGARDRAEAEALAAPGDPVTFVSDWRDLGGGRFCVKAIDDRCGCALLLELLRSELPCDCTFVFSVQEENGCFGARTAGFTVQADISIAVEGTTASDIPGAEGAKRVCVMGGGPVISHMDTGTIYDHELYRRAARLAEANGIPWQTKQLVAGGNESRSYQAAGAGSRVLAVSLPVRYIHSATSVADMADAVRTEKLLRLLVEEFAG